MATITVKTQAEFDALPKSFDNFTFVEIRSSPGIWIEVRSTPSNSQVVAYDSSQVVAYDSSQVVAYGSSQVVAYDSSQVRAYGSSQVRACDSSQVVAYGSSQVRAYGYSVCSIMSNQAKLIANGPNVVSVHPKYAQNSDEWLQNNGVDVDAEDSVVLFKKVSKDFLTQEGTENETRWTPGIVVECPGWDPGVKECGPGKLHACPSPGLCDQFRNEPDDKYIAVRVKKADMFVWTKSTPSYPHKVAFRAGLVLGECDMMGNMKK